MNKALRTLAKVEMLRSTKLSQQEIDTIFENMSKEAREYQEIREEVEEMLG